jgi:hypothetical protein
MNDPSLYTCCIHIPWFTSTTEPTHSGNDHRISYVYNIDRLLQSLSTRPIYLMVFITETQGFPPGTEGSPGACPVLTKAPRPRCPRWDTTQQNQFLRRTAK